MHLLYVKDSVDELIYGKTEWSDLTGESANKYWQWKLGVDQPEELPGPPMTPRPTESHAWDELKDATLPAVWPGEVTGQEYSVTTTGVVHNAYKRLIANPQGVADMFAGFRGRRRRTVPGHARAPAGHCLGGHEGLAHALVVGPHRRALRCR